MSDSFRIRLNKEWRQPDVCQSCGAAAPPTRTLKVPSIVWALLVHDIGSTRRYQPMDPSIDMKTIAVHGPNKTYYFELDE